MKTTNISYRFSKKTVATGVFAILAVVGIGFSVGLGAGVFDVPFAHAGGSYSHKPTCTLTASADSTSLSWTTTNATSASIDNGVGDISTVDAGSIALAAASATATTYTMTVTGPGGVGTCSTATSVAVAIAVSCAASSASVVAGDSVTWTAAIAAAGAGSYSYSWSGTDGLAGSASSVSQSYSTAGTKSATVTVTSGGQTATANCSTTVTPPPPSAPTCTLTANPSTINQGDTSKLSWTTTNATSFSINQGIGSVTPVASGNKSVSPTSDTSYAGTVTGPGGTAKCYTKVMVQQQNTCNLMVSCAASASSVQIGDSVTWTANATGNMGDPVSYSWSGTDSLSGSSANVNKSYSTGGTKSATVTVTSGTQTATATCSTTVNTPPPPPPVTCTLSANPTSVASGSASTLSWTTSGATSFSIDHGIGSETATSSGSDSTSNLTATTTFTGTATGPGGTKTCTATVKVTTSPPACTTYAFGDKHITGSVNKGNATLTVPADACPVKISFSSYNLPDGKLQPFSHQVLLDNITDTYTPGTHNIGPLKLACNWQSDLYWGDVQTKIADSGTVGLIAYDYLAGQTCSAPTPPTCTLNISPSSITSGHAATLSWTTTNAIAFTIDHSIGSVASIGSGSTTTSPTITTTYTGTATGAAGSVTCKTTITVNTPPPPAAPTCSLTATPDSIKPGAMSTLSWTTTNATSFASDQGIGSTTPVAGGSQKVSPTITTTYTGTATGPGGSVTCPATVTVTPNPPPPPAPTCTLSASPSQVSSAGGTTVLSWTTTDATSFAIDNGVGNQTSLASGTTTSPGISVNTTFTGTVTGPGGTATCSTPVTVPTGGGGGPSYSCSLTASPDSLGVGGGSTTLTWGGQNIQSVFIDNGVGTTTNVTGTTNVTVNSNTTFTGTFIATNGQTLTCQATVHVQTGGGGGGGCAGNCGGGGGGGGYPQPSVVLASLPHVGNAPLAFLYLSQIPYTGLDLGPIGTIVYWAGLIIWSLAAAYLVLFGAFPYLTGRMKNFGERVAEALKAEPATAPAYAYAPAPRVAPAPVIEPEQGRMSTYTAYDGFKSLATSDKLSIEDIVKGLSRQINNPGVSGESHEWVEAAPAQHAPEPSAPRSYEAASSRYENVEPIYENVEPIAPEVRKTAAPAPMFVSRADTAPAPKAETFPPEVPDFLSMLVAGNREAVFEMYRSAIRSGVDSETFLTQVACALDDAYRARIEGTPVHAEVSRHTNNLATPVLEKLVNALSTAVDSSYSLDITGGKLALTRALATLGA